MTSHEEYILPTSLIDYLFWTVPSRIDMPMNTPTYIIEQYDEWSDNMLQRTDIEFFIQEGSVTDIGWQSNNDLNDETCPCSIVRFRVNAKAYEPCPVKAQLVASMQTPTKLPF